MDLDGSPRPREPQRSDVNATQQQQQRLSASRAVSPAAERPLSPVLMSPSPRGGGGRHRGESPSVGRCSSMPQPPVVMCDRALVWQPSPLQAASARIHHHHHRPPTAPGRSVSAPRSQSHRQDASSRQQQRSRTPGRTNLRPPTAPRPTTSSKSAARKDDGTHRSHHVSIKEDRRTATAAAATTAPHSPSPKMDRKPDRAAVSPCGHAAAERRGTNCFQGDASNVQATSWQQQRPPRRRKEVKDAPPLGSNTNNKTVDSRPQNTAAQAISSSGGINSNSNNGWNGNPLTSSHNLVTADITFRGVNDTPPPSSSSNRLQHQGRRMSFLSGNNNIQLSLTETTGDIDVESILQTTGASGGPHILATSQFEENVGKAILRKDAARVGALLKLYGKLLSNQRHPLPEDGDPLQEEMGSGNVLDVTPLSRKCILLNDCESEFAASDSRGLLDRVVDPETGYTLMHLAVLTMDKRIVHECLRHGSEVHAIADVQGDTPLTLAMRRYPSCVQVLFTLGKNINVKRPVGFQQRELDVLLSQNSVPAAAADASAVVGDGAQNLLHCAVAADHRTPKWPGRLKFMELLVERYGLSASQEDMHGFTPILWAHEHERFLGPKETTAIVKYLKKAVRKEQRGHTSAAAAATPQAAAAVVAVSGERMDVLYKLTGLRRTSHNFMPPTHSSGVSPAPPHHHHRRRQLRVHSPPITRPSGATANGRLGAPSPPPLCPRSDRSPSAQASRHAVSAQSVVMGATSIGHEPSLGTVCGTPVSSSRLRVSRSPSPQVVVVEVAPTPSASRPRTQQQQRGYSAARGVSESCRPSLAHRAASQSVAAVLRGLEEAAPCSADVPRMTLFVARADRIRYRLQGPLARLLCVLLLFPLHALCYGLDVSTQWSGETRFDVWWRALNMIFSGWNGSAFVMGITHVLCAAAGLIGGYAFFVYVIGELVCCRALRLPMFGAQSTGERRYMRKELGLYYETFYNASRRPRLFLAVVGVLCGLAASAAVYNALIDTWWGGQASWAVITPVFSFMHPESCLLLLCALSLGLDVLLLCGLVDVMYQQGALSVYLPHYRFSQLADWVDLSATPWLQRHGLLRLPRLKLVLPEPWRTRYNSSTQSDHYYSVEGNLRRRSGGDKSEPPPASGDTIVVDGTRGGTCTPRLTLRPTLSLQRFRIWAFWTCCAMGWSVVFIAIVIAGTQRTARRHRTPTAAAAAADESAMVGRAVCCVLFASCALVLSVLIALQAWTWPTFQPHPHLAVPGLSATGSGAHLGWVLWLLLFGLASMDVRNAAENTRVVMQEGNAGQKAAVVLVLLPACMACMAQCAAVLSTSMRLRQQSPLGPSSIVDRRRDAPPPLRAWLAGTHLQLKPVPVTFGLLHSAEPDLPQWQAFLLASHGDGLQTEAALKEASPLPPPHTDSTVIECDDVDGKQNDDDNDDDVDGLLLKADDAERAVVELVEYMDAHDMLSGVHRRRASCRDKDTNNNNNNNNKATSNFSSSSSSCSSSSSSSSSSNTSAASSSSSSCGTANQGGEANSECPTSRQNDDNNNNAMAMTGPEEGDRLYERLRRILWLREQHRRSCVARCRGEVLAYAGATAAVRRKRFDVRERERMYLSVLQTKGTTTKR